MIQYETSEILVGNTNIAEAIETDDTLLFSETYVVVGKKLKAQKIHANYDLIMIGDIEASELEHPLSIRKMTLMIMEVIFRVCCLTHN